MSDAVENKVAVLFDEAERRLACAEPASRSVRAALERRRKRGTVVRPHRGVYARAEYWHALTPDARDLHVMRALQRQRPELVFCHESAALVWGLPVSYGRLGTIHTVSHDDGHPSRNQGIMRHRLPDDGEVTVREGLRVTGLVRTAFDCMRAMSFADALAVGDELLRKSTLIRREIRSRFIEMGKHARGCRRARGVLSYADARSESWAESAARALAVTQGFAMPELQVELAQPSCPGSVYRVDHVWVRTDGTKVLGEVDGAQKYYDERMLKGKTSGQAILMERQREAELTMYGMPVMRLSHADVTDAERFTEKLTKYGISRRPEIVPVVRALAKSNPDAAISFTVVTVSDVLEVLAGSDLGHE